MKLLKCLNEPLGTIKSRIHFARKLLKEQLIKILMQVLIVIFNHVIIQY